MLQNHIFHAVARASPRLLFLRRPIARSVSIMAKRKHSSAAIASRGSDALPPPPPPSKARRTSQRNPLAASALDPDENGQVIDAPEALRASPDSDDANEKLVSGQPNGVGRPSAQVIKEEVIEDDPSTKQGSKKQSKAVKADAKLDEMVLAAATRKSALKEKAPAKSDAAKSATGATADDPEADEEDADADPEEIKEALMRPPPVNSDYLPLPWKGRLGYACLCTYLRNASPPVFQSRTTRIASILDHRHPLKDPSQPEHPTKNRPDKEKLADVRLGQRFVEQLCLANCRDMAKMLRWNHKYNIKFLRLSSEAFPFASHAEYGYKLAPFASEALAEVGKVAAELGHRLTTHPGQFTQLGSPRKQVIDSSIRDLAYHEEMLSLLKLPPQQDRDAVMILHMGGMFGDKAATLDRFRENYKALSAGIKKRLVLENDDMCWSVHDLLPVCEELNIPFVLDFHHHNIIFDNTQIREGTEDIRALYPRILETWKRKGITPKMHYSEPTPAAITPKQRRKHNPRVATLPPCPPDMDLMIEAKDKEQAVFELMRTFKLPGYETIADIQPHIRRDENRPVRAVKPKATPKKGKKSAQETEVDDDEAAEDDAVLGPTIVSEDEIGMGGPEGRVYWPPGMEDWLRPVKKVVKKKEPVAAATPKSEPNPQPEPAATKTKTPKAKANLEKAEPLVNGTAKKANGAASKAAAAKPTTQHQKQSANTKPKAKAKATPTKKAETDETSDEGSAVDEDELTDDSEEESAEDQRAPAKRGRGASKVSRKSGRARGGRVSYKEEDDDEEEDD